MPAADKNLYDYIQENNQLLKIEERIELFDQIIAAIKFAHSKDILHRDISPRNILLFKKEEKYKVKVSDFGLGKNLLVDSAYTHSAVANYGQLYYVAPEQIAKLKDSTVRSDIYSLGRLLDFTLTGRAPVTIQPTSFRTLIEKAVQAEPDLRYESLSDFERSYESIKNLLGLNDEIENSGTVSNFINPDGTIDWKVFQRFAVKGDYKDSIFGEYVGVVIGVLTNQEHVRTYVNEAGDSIGEFVNVFMQRIDELPSTGWPFKAMTEFAQVLMYIFIEVSDSNIKLQCLKGIWKIAFEYDQFGAQRIMLSILEKRTIPQQIQMDFAVAIIESSATISPDAFSSPNIPQVIKRAIVQKANE